MGSPGSVMPAEDLSCPQRIATMTTGRSKLRIHQRKGEQMWTSLQKIRSCLLATLLFGIAASLSRADGPTFTHDVIYGHKAGMALTYDVVRPQNANGAGILFMVSGGWVSNWTSPENLVRAKHTEPNRFELLVDHGYTLFIVRHGSSPYFKVPDAVADVRRAVRFIRLHAADYGIDPNRLGVFGSSAGGHLSLMLGSASDEGIADSKDPVERVSDRVQAVVAICPPSRVEELFPLKERYPALQFPEDQADSVSPLSHASQDDPPTLMIHGDQDTLVPISHSERMQAALAKEKVPAELLIIPGAGHGFGQEDQIRCQNATLAWFDKYLGKQ